MSWPLRDYELEHLRRGHCLFRVRRSWLIMMWLTRAPGRGDGDGER